MSQDDLTEQTVEDMLVELAMLECAHDLMDWLNTLEDKKIDKELVYAWATKWRPSSWSNGEVK